MTAGLPRPPLRVLAHAAEGGCVCTDLHVPRLWQGVITLPDAVPGVGTRAAILVRAGQIKAALVLELWPGDVLPVALVATSRLGRGASREVRAYPGQGRGEARPCDAAAAA